MLPTDHWYQPDYLLRGKLSFLGLYVHSAYVCAQTILFERLGLSDVDSRILAACNGTEYFLASFLGIYLIDRVGRRPLILTCAAGQSVTMILLAILGSVNNSAAQIVSAVLLFVFNSFFAVGFLGLTWLYAAEIVGLNIRAPANALSTASNWVCYFPSYYLIQRVD